MKLNLSAEYGFKPTPAQLAVIRKHDPSADIYPEDYKYEYDRGRLKGYIKADPAQILREPELVNARWTIMATELDANIYTGILQQLEALTEKVSRYTAPELAAGSSSQQFNEKCSVHVPGLGLLLIDEVEVEEDCCTVRLQNKLNAGWRILAVCPQPDQRRPDYVLGKSSRA